MKHLIMGYKQDKPNQKDIEEHKEGREQIPNIMDIAYQLA